MSETFAIINQLVEQYRVVATLVGVGAFIFGIAWFLRSSRQELFAKLDNIADNHLTHIQAATEKSSATLTQVQIGMAAHDMRATAIGKELEDFRIEVRLRPSECPLIINKDNPTEPK
jgi:hypothetical protein